MNKHNRFKYGRFVPRRFQTVSNAAVSCIYGFKPFPLMPFQTGDGFNPFQIRPFHTGQIHSEFSVQLTRLREEEPLEAALLRTAGSPDQGLD